MIVELPNSIELAEESRRLFSLIQKNAPLTKPDLAQMSGYQMSSLNRYLEPLLAGGLVAPCGIGDSSGGRRPALLDVCENRFFVIGVNIATIYLEVVVINLKVRVLSKERFDLPRGTLPERAIGMARDSIARQLGRLGIDRGSVLGIGLSSIGPFDRELGVVLQPIVLHWEREWVGYPIRQNLAEACGFPVVADIGANNAGLVEYLFGNGRGFDRVLCVRCGMSIKTAYIVSGAIVRTNNNAEDAFGHMSIDIDGLPCVCGNYGCIECYSSIPALVKRFAAELKKGRVSSIGKPLPDIDYQDILAAAGAGDALAREIVIHGATVLGVGVANYINLINPDAIILDGLTIRQSDLFYQTAVDVAKRKSSLLAGNPVTRFIRNSHFEDPSTVGAAVLALESLLLKGDNLE